jgi:hypothetical protein
MKLIPMTAAHTIRCIVIVTGALTAIFAWWTA